MRKPFAWKARCAAISRRSRDGEGSLFKKSTIRSCSAENTDRIAEALKVPVYELFVKDSLAVEQAVSKFEVRERLEQKVFAVIQKALDEKSTIPKE